MVLRCAKDYNILYLPKKKKTTARHPFEFEEMKKNEKIKTE